MKNGKGKRAFPVLPELLVLRFNWHPSFPVIGSDVREYNTKNPSGTRKGRRDFPFYVVGLTLKGENEDKKRTQHTKSRGQDILFLNIFMKTVLELMKRTKAR